MVIDGGDGIDTVVVQGAGGVTLDLGASSIERAIGGAGADALNAATAAVAVTVYGGAGDDTITGSAFNDNLRGDAGGDTDLRRRRQRQISGGDRSRPAVRRRRRRHSLYRCCRHLIDGGAGTTRSVLSETFELMLDLGGQRDRAGLRRRGADRLDRLGVSGTVLLYGGAGGRYAAGRIGQRRPARRRRRRHHPGRSRQ